VSDGMGSSGRDGGVVTGGPFVLGEEPGAIVAGFDVHRRQITVDALDTATGEVWRGQIESTPAAVEEWVTGFPGRVIHVAVEACTGWLFVCRALERSGAVAHLAEPVETSALRGRKRRAKTDRTDAKWLRELLFGGRLPEAWVPPEHVRQWRSRARLRNTLVAARTSWIQRIRATLYHHGIAGAPTICGPWQAAGSSPAWSCPSTRGSGSAWRWRSSICSRFRSPRLSGTCARSRAARPVARRS